MGVRSWESIFLFGLLDGHRLRFADVVGPEAVLPGAFGGNFQIPANFVNSGGRHVSLLSDALVQERINFSLHQLRMQRFAVRMTSFLLWIVTLNSEVTATFRLHLELYHRSRAHEVVLNLVNRARYLVGPLAFFNTFEMLKAGNVRCSISRLNRTVTCLRPLVRPLRCPRGSYSHDCSCRKIALFGGLGQESSGSFVPEFKSSMIMVT